ncbi:Hypothetical protein SCF082_LOCUS1945 [Durusdinium trenchii]|uniref:Uncharacterized protein n=1 Tax=Durusdinium trenchii TaxID=1381693 RepID=A0ABP0HHR1_9DINO
MAVRQAPGGASTICLGADAAELKAISSNAFASNANQNSGNVLTERPSKTILAPPGGKSTIFLGNDSPSFKRSVPVKKGSATVVVLGENNTQDSVDAGVILGEDCHSTAEAKPAGVILGENYQDEAIAAGVILGEIGSVDETEETLKNPKEMAQQKAKKSEQIEALQSMPTPARRVPPGGVATVLLG